MLVFQNQTQFTSDVRHLILHCIQIQKEVFAEKKKKEKKAFEWWNCQKALQQVLWCLQEQVFTVLRVEEIQQFQDLYLSLKQLTIRPADSRHTRMSSQKNTDTHADIITKYSLFPQ